VFQLAKSEIRLQFSGYAIFAAKLLSVGTGFAFQIMLRAAIGDAYGIYFNMGDIIGYFTIMMGVVPFWAMRYVARGREGAIKTGLATNLAISLIGTAAYLAFVPFILSAILPTAVDYLPIYLLAGMQIAEYYAISIFESCLQAYKPHVVGYGLLFQQVSKLSAGYVVIVVLGQGLVGAVIVNIISFAVQLAYYFTLLGKELKQRVQWGYVREWFKGSLANIYSVVGSQVVAFGFILLFWYGSIESRGIYAAAALIASIIGFASFLSFALYPKLLTERRKEDAVESMKMVLMFTLPMATGAISLADSYMGLLDYRFAWVVLVVLSLDAIVTVVAGIYSAVIMGYESVDQNEGMTLKKLVKSKLFVSFSLPYVQAAISLPVIYYVLTTYAYHKSFEAAFYVAVINSVAHFITFIFLYALSRSMMKFQLPWKNIAKYLLASAAMGALLYFLPHPDSKLMTIALTAVGGLIYVAVLSAIDKEARALPKAILQEVLSRRKKSAKPNS
jgi:hypothetical protein